MMLPPLGGRGPVAIMKSWERRCGGTGLATNKEHTSKLAKTKHLVTREIVFSQCSRQRGGKDKSGAQHARGKYTGAIYRCF
jgi:hypothetical protein